MSFGVAVFHLFIVNLLAAIPIAALGAQNSNPCAQMNLPTPINELLKAKFSDWRTKEVSDLEPDDEKLWLKAHGKECPGKIVGRFENADRLAYAVLLVPISEPTGGYKLVVLSKASRAGTYDWKVLDQSNDRTYSGLVISKAAPGKYSDAEGTRSIKIRFDSIYLEWIEKGAVLYYWSAGRYHKLQVSE